MTGQACVNEWTIPLDRSAEPFWRGKGIPKIEALVQIFHFWVCHLRTTYCSYVTASDHRWPSFESGKSILVSATPRLVRLLKWMDRQTRRVNCCREVWKRFDYFTDLTESWVGKCSKNTGFCKKNDLYLWVTEGDPGFKSGQNHFLYPTPLTSPWLPVPFVTVRRNWRH